jgi:hypothetical protein
MRVVLYSLAGGILLTLYSQIPDMLRYVFSLLALLLGIRFFRRFESKGPRIAFVLMLIFYYLIFNLMYVIAAQVYGWKNFLQP